MEVAAVMAPQNEIDKMIDKSNGDANEDNR